MARPTIMMAITFLFFAAAASAQESRSLSLDEAVALGLENYRGLHAAQMRAEAADARHAETRAIAGPAAQLSGGYTYLSTVPEFSIPAPVSDAGSLTLNPSINNSYQILLSARQALYTGGRLSGAREAAQARAFAARDDLSAERAALVLRVKLAYWALAGAGGERRAVEEDIAQVEAHRTDVERLLAEGMATAGDLLKVETRLSAARFRSIRADHAVRSASMTVANLIGLPIEIPLAPSTPLPFPFEPEPDAADLIVGAQEGRAELRALRLRVEAARAAVTVARAERLPQVSLAAHYLYGRPNARIFPAEDRFNDTWDIGLGIAFDLWDGGAVAQRVKQAEARVREAEDALALMADGVALEIRQALLSLEEARALIAVAAIGARQAEEDLRVTRERFREGLVLNSEVLDAEVALLEARLRHTLALAAHAGALALLDRAVGR